MNNNGFEYIENNNNNTETTNIDIPSEDNELSLPDWDLLPPFDEIERGEVK